MLIEDHGEEAFLAELKELFAPTAAGVPAGIGDDAAVLKAGGANVWTTDMMIEGIHFRREWQTAAQLGSKALAVNLSDLASMGASPVYALLSLAIPPGTETVYLHELCEGIAARALEDGVAVVGGDTTAAKESLVISMALGGEVAGGEALLRSGAQPGDRILLTGYPGRAAAGMRLSALGEESYPSLRQAFISPRARLGEGKAALAAGVSAATDTSDGLASDLRHICRESGVGARLERESLPLDADLSEAALRFGWDIDELIFCGGEDYELLMTAPAGNAAAAVAKIAAVAGVSVTDIGEITDASEGLTVQDADGGTGDLPERGYEHFRS